MGIGKIIQLVGVLVALIAGVMDGFNYSPLIITLLGIAGGWFIGKDDRTRFLIGTLALIAVQGAWGGLPEVGSYLSNALGGLAALFSAGAVTVILVSVWDHLKP